MATVPRAPLFIEPPPRRPLGGYVIVNATILLASVVVAALPFNQKNWTPPPLKNAATFDSNWIPNTLAAYLAATVKPFSLTDWQAAPLKSAQTWDFRPPNALVLYPAPATKPFGLTDWNTPPLKNAQTWDSNWIPNNFANDLARTVKPFNLTDWNAAQLVNGRVWWDSNWIPNTILRNSVPIAKPFGLTDWSPAPLKNAQTWDFWNPNNFASHLALTVKPFKQTEWQPAPLRNAQIWDFSTPNNLVRYPLTATKPFSLTDWNPAPLNAGRLWDSNWILNLAPTFTAVASVGGGIQAYGNRKIAYVRRKPEYKFLEELENDLLYVEEAVQEAFQRDIPIPKATLKAEQLQLKRLENAYQIQVASIEIALDFIEERKNEILEDELAIIIGIAIADDDP